LCITIANDLILSKFDEIWVAAISIPYERWMA
jgi:hypothetical protein